MITQISLPVTAVTATFLTGRLAFHCDKSATGLRRRGRRHKRGRQTLRPTETWILSKSSRFEILTPATTKKSLRLRRGAPARERGAPTREVLRHARKVLRHARGAPAHERCSGTQGAPAREVLRHAREVLRHARKVLRHARGALAREVLRRGKRCSGTREVFRPEMCSGTRDGFRHKKDAGPRDNDVIMGGYGTVGTRHSGV